VIDLVQLDPAAGLEAVVDLAEESWPVADGGGHVADVDVVVALGLCPVKLGIVDDEADVGGHPGWLDGAEVVSNDICAGIEVAEVDGPDAGASANVEDTQTVGVNGREEEAVVEEAEEGVMHHVEAVLLALVVGKGVRARLVRVVTTTMLPLETEDAAAERGAGGRGRRVPVRRVGFVRVHLDTHQRGRALHLHRGRRRRCCCGCRVVHLPRRG